MSIVAGFWATAGVSAIFAFILALSSISTEWVRTARILSAWAGTCLAVTFAASITAIWLAVAGL